MKQGVPQLHHNTTEFSWMLEFIYGFLPLNRGLESVVKFGLMIQPRSIEQTVTLSQLAEKFGYEWVGIADSPVVYQESYLHQMAALQATHNLMVGPLVSHVVLRHPIVVANSLSTLNEMSGGRVRAAIGTGNSAARGFSLPPTTLEQIGEALLCMRAWWEGESAQFGSSRIAGTGIQRRGCSLFVAADGPAGARLAAQIGDGFVFGGGLDNQLVRDRVAMGIHSSEQKAWIAPAVSLATTRDAVIRDMGAQMIAMANRALRGDLYTQGVPSEFHEAVKGLRGSYDYAFHADGNRPINIAAASRELADYLVDRMVIWGDKNRWGQVIERLSENCDGIMLILGQRDPVSVVGAISERLKSLGALAARATRPFSVN